MTGDAEIVRLAVRLTLIWVHAYTAHLPPPIRDSRRAEIESDVWEWRHDGEQARHPPATLAALLVVRLLAGLLDDAAWTWEHHQLLSRGRGVWPVAGSAVAVALVALWLWSETAAAMPPALPAPPYRLHQPPPEPPPPPPPPPARWASTARE